MSTVETSQSVFEEIHEEHEHLQELYSRVRAEFEAAVAGKPNGLNGLFTVLVDVLEKHFAHEERVDIFVRLSRRCPVSLPRSSGCNASTGCCWRRHRSCG